MMFHTLYSRLALTLFVLLLVVGVVLVQLIGRSSVLYQQEVAQKLNHELAEHIVYDIPLVQGSEINKNTLEVLFHNLMVVNPSIELYLLDVNGKIIAYNAPEGSVKRTSVALTPVLEFIEGDSRYPKKGDDPRSLGHQKVFSAAKISNENGLQGYLYIVLGGEQYDHVVQMLGNSYIVDASVKVLAIALTAAMLGGLVLFGLQTRRLKLLGNVMTGYAARSKEGDMSLRFPESNNNDEIGVLGKQFNAMAEKIDEQIHDLKKTDGMRREMVANVSHDLRTPLTTMGGYLETLLLKHDSLSDEEQKQYLKTALNYSKHLGKLVEDLFELASLDSCESVVYAEPFSMGELVQDVTQSFMLRAEQKSIDIEYSLNSDAPLIYGDIAMMQRVLENLLENGLRHTPEGGRISIDVDVDSGSVVVKVADTGCGIPQEDVPKIFERFYQQDTSRAVNNNAGLGLAIVKRILELHGSVIKVTSDLNHGTTFSFRVDTRPAT